MTAKQRTFDINSTRPDDFLVMFNPSKQDVYCRSIDRCFIGTAPSLAKVAQCYGTNIAKTWLDCQLRELSEYCGCKDKMTTAQLIECSKVVLSNYGYLKVTELMYFFNRFKAGKYGRFYGSVDPLVITSALYDFITEREAILARARSRQREWERANSDENRNYIRAYKRREAIARFYSLNFRSDDFTLDEFRELWWLFNLGYERRCHGYSE